MEKLKVGDTVRLINGLTVGETYDEFTFREKMKFENEKVVEEMANYSCRIGIYYYPFSIIERVEPC